MKINKAKLFLYLILTFLGFENKVYSSPNVKVLADLNFLQNMGITPDAQDDKLNLATATISQYQAIALSHFAHNFHKCGGFEDITPSKALFSKNDNVDNNNVDHDIFSTIQKYHTLNNNYSQFSVRKLNISKKEEITNAIEQLSESNLQKTVQWLSSFPSRYHKSEDGKKATESLITKLNSMIDSSGRTGITVELVPHIKTPQSSIRVTVPGSTHSDEIVVLGGHFDSIATWGLGKAPGADDNASGSSNILEAFRVFLTLPPQQRSVEFYWYAGEEAGLLGSAEIAAQYKNLGKKVISVLQLDMTLFPGDGELVIGDMTDFTSVWLRDILKELNTHYVGARFKEDKCGYGCSDHASWYKNGFPTAIPFEATMRTMNDNIHTINDVISPALNFNHSLAFTKLALAYIMELSNSDLKQPY